MVLLHKLSGVRECYVMDLRVVWIWLFSVALSLYVVLGERRRLFVLHVKAVAACFLMGSPFPLSFFFCWGLGEFWWMGYGYGSCSLVDGYRLRDLGFLFLI